MRERFTWSSQPGAKAGKDGLRAREVAIDDRFSRRHDSLADGGPEEEMRPRVEAVLPGDVAASPRGQPILRRRALPEGSGVGVDPERGGRQAAPPASSDTADPQVDVFEVGEERSVEAADVEKRRPIERCGAAARGEG